MAAPHTATVVWTRGTDDFLDQRYHRSHQWRFDGGATVAASSSPHVVPLPYSDAAAVDPEEAYIAALASCHMLWFLDIASRTGWRVNRYTDAATGTMAQDAEGRLVVRHVQ
nr:OsmC family protein [Acidovorax temperans]